MSRTRRAFRRELNAILRKTEEWMAEGERGTMDASRKAQKDCVVMTEKFVAKWAPKEA